MMKNIFQISIRTLSSTTASIVRPRRKVALRTYPTVLVLPDGATINIRYHEPRKIITLPLDINTLTEDERRERIEKRKPKKQVKIIDEFEDSFNANKYLLKFKK